MVDTKATILGAKFYVSWARFRVGLHLKQASVQNLLISGGLTDMVNMVIINFVRNKYITSVCGQGQIRIVLYLRVCTMLARSNFSIYR